MNKLSFLFLPLTALSVSSCAPGKSKEEAKRPNIIFMMTDDHTTQAMSCYGSRLLSTPIWIELPKKVFVWIIAMQSMHCPAPQELAC